MATFCIISPTTKISEQKEKVQYKAFLGITCAIQRIPREKYLLWVHSLVIRH